jgi:hypothetical protein
MTLTAVATLFLGGAALGEPMGKAVVSPVGGDAKTGAAAQKGPGSPGEGGKMGKPAGAEAPGVEGRSAAPGAPSDTESSGAGPAGGNNTGPGAAKASAKEGPAASGAGANAGAGPAQKAKTGRSSASMSSDDRTKVRSEISRAQIREATNLKFRVNVGATAPRTITEYWEPIPQEIVTIVPAWSGYRVVRIGNEILIIEPDRYQIVDVLED